MPRTKAFLLSQILSLLTISLTGCLPPRFKSEDIVGLWVEVKTPLSPANLGANCGSFEFLSDGSFVAHNIPGEYFILAGVSPTRISTSGTWGIGAPSQDPFAFQQINLQFGSFEGFPLGFDSSILISSDGSRRILVKWMGESNRITFVRTDKHECQ